ncbi:MAG: hypothetical protein AVO33_06220 [delta proteobacterium ML8_F1]|nr:MAG: hypothetical protein AVO33_06220 [delta proteobacterium ML8_F1]
MLDYRPIPYSAIPDIGLYMDQVLSFLERELGVFYKDSRENILTKSMVNNYVKAGILQKPARKKYDQVHLSKMIMIYFLKNIISMEEIQPLVNHGDSPETLYETFRKIHCGIYENTSAPLESIEKKPTSLEVVFYLILQADINKRMAKELIKSL